MTNEQKELLMRIGELRGMGKHTEANEMQAKFEADATPQPPEMPAGKMSHRDKAKFINEFGADAYLQRVRDAK